MGLYIVFVSVGQPALWSIWSRGKTDTKYYSDFLTQEGVDDLIEKLKRKYPDSNLVDDDIYHEYYITYVVLKADTLIEDKNSFWNLLVMMNCDGGKL